MFYFKPHIASNIKFLKINDIKIINDEMKDLIKGIAPNRDDFDDENKPNSPVKPSVPKSSGAAATQPN